MTDIPFNKRYIYDLDDSLLQGLQTLYFDTLTHEPRPKSQFLERRKEEIDDSEAVKKAPKSIKHHDNAHLEQIQRQLESLALKNKDISPDSEEISPIKEEDEEIVDEEDETEDIDLYKRIKTSLPVETPPSEFEESTISFMATKSPQVLFSSPLLDQSKAIAVYKSLISAQDSPNFDPILHLKSLSSHKINKDPIKSGISAIFMLTSGHFAGAIISHLPHSTKGNQGTQLSLQLQSVRMIQQKTFHRYTTRRKQGGSQSSMDDAKGKANSAGSTLRRYNEQALEQDIAQLLKDWKVLIDECDHIFIRAMGKAGRLLVKQKGEAGGIIFNDDDRIKTIPFGTGRPTATEIKKAWVELTHLQIVDLPKVSTSEINKQKRKQQALEKSHITAKKVEEVQISNQETELINLLKKSKAPAFLMYLKKNKIDVNIFRFNLATTPTLLHYASAHGLQHMVKTLLVQCKASPSIINDRSKTPFEISGSYANDNKQLVELEFSLAKNQYPDLDWTEAGEIVPMTLDDVEKAKSDLKNERATKDELDRKAKQKALDDAITQKIEDDKLLEAQMKDKKLGKGQSIANKVIQTEEQKLAGLTPEQKMKVMREQRARAIEARMSQMNTQK